MHSLATPAEALRACPLEPRARVHGSDEVLVQLRAPDGRGLAL